jgi:microcin C transport system permease protein
MGAYILRRILLIVPTLFVIMAVNFAVLQLVPGGPVERFIARIEQRGVAATDRVSGARSELSGGESSAYRGRAGVRAELIERLQEQYGLDRPVGERFRKMLWSYLRFDFGDSYYRNASVWELLVEKLPTSISLGLWSTLAIYGLSIPLGIAKAVRDGSRFDVGTSSLVIFGTAIPSFLAAILLLVLFAGGRYLDWFPLRGLVSDDWADLSWPKRVLDYLWHITLPVLSITIAGFASLTMLTKNSFLDEINKQYVLTARAKGLPMRRVLYGHVFRNAMLIVIAGFPSALVGILFTGSLLVEVIFSLDGIGLLSFESVINRDYPVMLGTLYLFSILGLMMTLITDLTYAWVDPRIDFASREV